MMEMVKKMSASSLQPGWTIYLFHGIQSVPDKPTVPGPVGLTRTNWSENDSCHDVDVSNPE